MSNSDQLNFLRKLDAELRRDENYRKEVADLKTHTLTISRRAINRGIADALRFEFEGITDQQINTILRTVANGVGQILSKSADRIRIQASNDPDNVILNSQTAHTVKATFNAKGSNRFDKAYKSYRDNLELFMPKLNQAVQEVLGKESNFSKKQIWNLEHAKFQGVLESQVRDAIDNALADQTEIDMKQVSDFLKSRGVSLRVYRNSKTDTMKVFLGSFRANIKEGQISKARKAELQRALETAITKLEKSPDTAFASLKGSDSFQTLKRKKVLKSVLEPFKGSKYAKVTAGESTKPKHSTTDNTKEIKPKVKTSKRLRKKNLKKSRRVRNSSVASSPLRLLATINARLPAVIMQNMGYPGLENRTGRFASSVRVVDFNITAKGFPSLGYTYQKNPYQTFEVGFKQGNLDRDPRTLIDRSIREIAAQYAMGRFYTRRV